MGVVCVQIDLTVFCLGSDAQACVLHLVSLCVCPISGSVFFGTARVCMCPIDCCHGNSHRTVFSAEVWGDATEAGDDISQLWTGHAQTHEVSHTWQINTPFILNTKDS